MRCFCVFHHALVSFLPSLLIAAVARAAHWFGLGEGKKKKERVRQQED